MEKSSGLDRRATECPLPFGEEISNFEHSRRFACNCSDSSHDGGQIHGGMSRSFHFVELLRKSSLSQRGVLFTVSRCRLDRFRPTNITRQSISPSHISNRFVRYNPSSAMTSRQYGVLRLVAGFIGVAAIHAGAQDSSIPGDVPALRTGEEIAYSTGSTNYTTSINEGADETAAYIARGYASTMDENEQRLTVIDDSLLMESVCNGDPVVFLKSMTVPANGACLLAQSRYNLSCSCLSGFTNQTEWTFHIRAPDSDPVSPFPTTLNMSSIVTVNSLMLLDVPAELVSM
uniref:Uncharacterized protein n=1 Tax=Hyaloperonospora arabidopsidis (strain Emoy2) TaxID=559515 RepID=M4BA18_HYAAE